MRCVEGAGLVAGWLSPHRGCCSAPTAALAQPPWRWSYRMAERVGQVGQPDSIIRCRSTLRPPSRGDSSSSISAMVRRLGPRVGLEFREQADVAVGTAGAFQCGTEERQPGGCRSGGRGFSGLCRPGRCAWRQLSPVEAARSVGIGSRAHATDGSTRSTDSSGCCFPTDQVGCGDRI